MNMIISIIYCFCRVTVGLAWTSRLPCLVLPMRGSWRGTWLVEILERVYHSGRGGGQTYMNNSQYLSSPGRELLMAPSAFQLCNGSAMQTSPITRFSMLSKTIIISNFFLFLDNPNVQPHKRLYTFFCSLYAALSRGSRAVFQFYPENSMQVSTKAEP